MCIAKQEKNAKGISKTFTSKKVANEFQCQHIMNF